MLGDILGGIITIIGGIINPAPPPTGPCPTVFSEYNIQAPSANPQEITKGSDGNVWFYEVSENFQYHPKIARITPTGTITEFQVPAAPGAYINDMVGGPDGAIWFTLLDNGTSSIGRIDINGNVTEFTLSSGLYPSQIVSAPDGNLWFTAYNASQSVSVLERITTNGTVTGFPLNYSVLPTGGDIQALTVGPDGQLWFTYRGDSRDLVEGVGHVALDGTTFGYIPMTPMDRGMTGLTTGPDGALWISEYRSGPHAISRMTTDGQLTEYSIGEDLQANHIIQGPNNTLWFSTLQGAIGRITPAPFKADIFWSPTADALHMDLTVGGDGNIWSTEAQINKIARLTIPTGAYVAPPTNIAPVSNPNNHPGLSWTAVQGASSYIICRDGTQFARTTRTNYTDNTNLSNGDYTYSVLTVNGSNQLSDRSRPYKFTVSN